MMQGRGAWAGRAWAGPLAVLAAGAGMLAWSWRRWPDVLVDFGRELYVPWRLAAGEVLYADLAYFNGPLSPYLNALWFRSFGAGLGTLAVCNAVLAALLGALLYWLVARIADRVAATAAGVVFVGAFAFAQVDDIANYNYVTPYSHEVTHGLLLGLLALAATWRYNAHPTPARAVLPGLLLGLVFLTKAEMFAAAAGAVGVGLLLTFDHRKLGLRRALGALAVLGGSALLPVLLSVALLATAMPLAEALWGTLGSWRYVFDPRLTSQFFYRYSLGTLFLEENLWSLAKWTGAYAACVAPALAVSLAPRRSSRLWPPGALLAMATPVMLVLMVDFAPARIVRPLPILLPALGLLALVHYARRRRQAGAEVPLLAVMGLTYATLLLAKIFLNVRLVHYGFVLAMPGTLALVAAGVCWLPRWVEGRGGAGGLVRATAVVAVGAALLSVLWVVDTQLDQRTVPVGTGGDRFHAGKLARPVEATRREIEARLGPRETFAVLPEGVMLNYLTRRVNPTGHINFMPPEMVMFGEEAILEGFRRDPPDYIVLAHKDTSEYGVRYFGRHYGRALFRWLTREYRPVWRVGARPLRTNAFGVEIWGRREAAKDERPGRSGPSGAAPGSAGAPRSGGRSGAGLPGHEDPLAVRQEPGLLSGGEQGVAVEAGLGRPGSGTGRHPLEGPHLPGEPASEGVARRVPEPGADLLPGGAGTLAAQ